MSERASESVLVSVSGCECNVSMLALFPKLCCKQFCSRVFVLLSFRPRLSSTHNALSSLHLSYTSAIVAFAGRLPACQHSGSDAEDEEHTTRKVNLMRIISMVWRHSQIAAQ